MKLSIFVSTVTIRQIGKAPFNNTLGHNTAFDVSFYNMYIKIGLPFSFGQYRILIVSWISWNWKHFGDLNYLSDFELELEGQSRKSEFPTFRVGSRFNRIRISGYNIYLSSFDYTVQTFLLKV